MMNIIYVITKDSSLKSNKIMEGLVVPYNTIEIFFGSPKQVVASLKAYYCNIYY